MSSLSHDTPGAGNDRRGRAAASPTRIPPAGWRDIAKRVISEFGDDRVTLVAAGATFFMLLALFPALAAFVSIYGVVSDPKTLADHIAYLGGLLPAGGLELIEEQLRKLVSRDPAALSAGFVIGLLVALWGANSGVKTLFTAMNVAYDEEEKRGLVRFHLTTLAFTLGAIGIGVALLLSVGVVPVLLDYAGLRDSVEWLISVARWPLVFLVCWIGIALIYRFGPSRTHPKWRWILPGSFAATLLWLAMSVLFSWYLQNFADYSATYGSLGAVVGFMMWTYLSSIVLIMGAELNSEIEHQTAIDSTVGSDRPMGERGAVMADTLGEASDEARD
ncbi:MAG: YihY/virulence factor BrkB family protein [Alphaproteobacteria bacterium]|nr:YihY/virulence factor BrkB family protein [Alphaproteobacteria bacterium]